MRGALLLSSLALASLIGCRNPTPVEPGVAPPVAAASEPAPAVELAPGLRVRITPTLEPRPQVHVAITVTGPAEPDESLRTWSLSGPVAAPVQPSVRDRAGEIEAAIETDGAGLRVTLDRAPSLPVTLEYVVEPVAATLGSVARIEIDEAHFFATGEPLLLLPDGALDRRQPLAVEIVADALAPEDPEVAVAMPPLRAASSFAPEPEVTVDGWPFELRRAAFVAGLLEWAQFDSVRGDDRWLGLGPTRFDPRWSAAELAGVRSIVDATIGMPTYDPLITISLGSPRSAAEPPFAAELRGRGLLIVADQGAIWDASARMTSTQALVARWLGGRVRLVEPAGVEHPLERVLWFDTGVTRFVARELLYELGLLDDDEYAAELDLIELELATSPLRERTLDELAALIADGDRDPAARLAATDARSLLVARGAMYAAWLDNQLRERNGQWNTVGVIEALRMLVAHAVAEGRRELPVEQFIHRAAIKSSPTEPPDAAFAAGFESVVIRGQRPKLTDGVFGPCFRPRKRKLRRFELGFIETTQFADERPSFTALDPNGPAARAGLRADDSLISLDYVPGEPDQRVTVRVARGEAIEIIEYQPAGPIRPVIQWQRIDGVPAESCPL
ncbi:MAG TPA: hypothetical protein VK034_06920 [Enhygromyxa sp.]|nr:hypothetical protein [Enhygromyxa sp.]